MSASTFRVTLLIAAAVALSPSTGSAQSAPGVPGELFNDNYDLQFFEPFDLDLDNVPARRRGGYFFSVEKTYWNISGDRLEIGVPGATRTAEIVYPVTGFSDGVSPTPHQVPNSILDAAPDAEYGYGDRYEFGYSDGKTGFLVGVLDGPSALSLRTFGFGEGFPFGGNSTIPGVFNFGTGSLTDTPGVDPFFTDGGIDDNANGVGDGDGPTAAFRALGFGSVHVVFNAPAGYFLGFRDYLINLAGPLNGTNTGPIYTVINTGSLDEDFEAGGTDFEAIFLTDDLDNDGSPGGLLITNPVTGLVSVAVDFDDLHSFNVFFDQLTTRNVTETQGIELMRTFDLDNRNKMRRKQNAALQLAYGVRFLRVRDQFSWIGLGSILGETSTATEIDNQMIGPQVALKYAKQRGQWRFEAQGRAFAAYNVADISQDNRFGGELVPGAINRPIFGRSTASAYGEQRQEVSPLVELRLNSRYFVTSGVSLNVGYTMTFVDNIHRAGLSTLYNTPGVTLADGSTSSGFGIGDGKSHVFINGVNFGIEGRF